MYILTSMWHFILDVSAVNNVWLDIYPNLS